MMWLNMLQRLNSESESHVYSRVSDSESHDDSGFRDSVKNYMLNKVNYIGDCAKRFKHRIAEIVSTISEKLAHITGRKIIPYIRNVIVKGLGPNVLGAWDENGTLYISPDSLNNLSPVISHEVVHAYGNAISRRWMFIKAIYPIVVENYENLLNNISNPFVRAYYRAMKPFIITYNTLKLANDMEEGFTSYINNKYLSKGTNEYPELKRIMENAMNYLRTLYTNTRELLKNMITGKTNTRHVRDAIRYGLDRNANRHGLQYA